MSFGDVMKYIKRELIGGGSRPAAGRRSAPAKKQHLGRRGAGGFETDTRQVYTLDGIPKVGPVQCTCEHCGKECKAAEQAAQRAADEAVKKAITGSFTTHRAGSFEAQIVTGADGRPLSVMLK